MYSLIKFYLELPDAKRNVKVEPSVLYPLARRENIFFFCKSPCQGNQNNDPSQTGQRKQQGWCGMAKFVPWCVPFSPSSVETGIGTIIINGSEHLLTKSGEIRIWSSGLCFSPQVPLVSGKSHHPEQSCRVSMTCSIWAFSPARTCDKRMKCSFSPPLKSCSPSRYELDSQAEYLPL